MTGRAKVAGLSRLLKRLDPAPVLQPALRAAGEDVVRQTRRELASQSADDALAESLTVSACSNSVEIGTDHPAARQTEFGTLHQAPRPWLQPAFQAAIGPVRARLRQAVKDHLTQRQRTSP